MIPLSYYLVLGAVVFCIGLFGALTRRNAVMVLISLELMLNAIVLNLIAFSNFVTPATLKGQIFSLFVLVVAASEIGLGLAIVLFLYRKRATIEMEDFTELKG
ncbi:MAG: NADH-quinone oxidoreductase subunit NuoK [Terriglobia bacterium]